MTSHSGHHRAENGKGIQKVQPSHRYSELQLLQNRLRTMCNALPRTFDSLESWEAYRIKLIAHLADTLPLLEESSDREAHVTASIDLEEDLLIEAVDVPLLADYDSPCHVYQSRTHGEPMPAVIICPGYGQAKNASDIIDISIELARRGFLVATTDFGGTGERADRPDIATDVNNVSALASLIGYTNIGLRIFTVRRLLDYLLCRADIDPDRIGITGICQGSIITWFTAALDQRLAAVSLLCGATTYEAIATEYMNRQGGWSGISPYAHGILRIGDIQHVISAIAPRPLQVQNNLIDRHWPLSGFQQVRELTTRVYSLYGCAERVGFRLAHGTHAYAEPFISNIAEWFSEVLKIGR